MKKHVQKFESFQIKKRLDDAIQESVMQVNDIYKVKAIVDIPKSLINQVIKKVKDESGKDLRNFYGDQDIAEELIKYINQTFVNADSIPTAALVGGEAPKAQVAQAQVAPAEVQAQVAPEGQAQAQAQVQVEAQPAAQTTAEPTAQVQAQPEAQATGEFENVEGEEEGGETEEEETEEEKAQREAEEGEEGEEENLPL